MLPGLPAKTTRSSPSSRLAKSFRVPGLGARASDTGLRASGLGFYELQKGTGVLQGLEGLGSSGLVRLV